MPKRIARFDSGDKWDDPDLIYADHPDAAALTQTLLPTQKLNLNSTTSMEYWEVTKDRAEKTLPVWTTHVPATKIRGQGPADLEAMIDGFQPLVQGRIEAQDVFDGAFRDVQSALLKMKLLGTKLPVFIEIQLAENANIQKDVDDLYAVNPRTEGTILKRAGMLLPVWERANAALAAMTPAQPALVLNIQGVAYTAAMLETLLQGYTGLTKMVEKKSSLLDDAREALRAHDRVCDRLNKDWYRLVKTGADGNAALLAALEGIPTEPSTPAPEVVEIDHVTQGGEEGLQTLVSYVPGGGAHATTKVVKWKVDGVDPEFTHAVPLDASGNALGPFAVGQVVHILTEVSNSAGTRTTAPRTITIEEPIG